MSGPRYSIRKHGFGGYSNGCRCDVCTEGKREYMRDRRKHVLPPGDPLHGTFTGYDNYSCRCWPCIVAKSENRIAVARKQGASG